MKMFAKCFILVLSNMTCKNFENWSVDCINGFFFLIVSLEMAGDHEDASVSNNFA